MTTEPRPPLLGRLPPAARLVLDGLAALGYGGLTWAVLAQSTGSRVALLAAAALGAVAVALTRRFPLAALPAVVAMYWLGTATGPAAGTLAFLAAAALAVPLFRVAATGRTGPAVVALVLALSAAPATAHPYLTLRGGVLPFGMAFCTVWTVGFAVGRHRRYRADLDRHHAQLARAELDDARRAVTDERLRIARELHDLVAHSMSVITVQAAFGHLVIDREPARAGAALGAIEQTGRETLVELRRLVGVLRADEPDEPDSQPALAPAPGLAGLAALLAQTATAGLRVDLRTVGTARPLPAGIDLTAYRIVQEALTNVIKHAGTDGAQVVIGYAGADLSIEITDDGRGGEPATGGHGLVGMRERVAVYGGRFAAGPLPGRGFRVSASLPLDDHP